MARIGTLLYRIFHGELVGKDEFGNAYYRSKTKKLGAHIGRGKTERRWVEYNGIAEPSKVPPYWHGWLHHIHQNAPTEQEMQPVYKWEKSHLPNLTGTDGAYRPSGHIASGGKRDKATGDYVAWSPDS